MNIVEPENDSINKVEDLKYNSKGQNYRQEGQMYSQTLPDLILEKGESKEEEGDIGEENVVTNQVESGRVPQLSAKDEAARQVKPIAVHSVDQPPFAAAAERDHKEQDRSFARAAKAARKDETSTRSKLKAQDYNRGSDTLRITTHNQLMVKKNH